MSFKISEIPGAVVEKPKVILYLYGSVENVENMGFIKGVDAQASVKLRINRERTLLELMKVNSPQGHSFIGYESFAIAVVDAIISAEKQIIEVVKEG